MKCMFDTNIFNDIVNEKINIATIKNEIKCYATSVQNTEIKRTANNDKKIMLLEIFSIAEIIPTRGFLLNQGLLNFDFLQHDELYQKILNSLNKKKKKNENDAIIARTAHANNLTLITHDMELMKVATDYKISVANLYSLIDKNI